MTTISFQINLRRSAKSIDDISYDIYFFTERTVEYFSKEKLLDQDELAELFMDHENAYRGIVSRNGINGIKNATRFSRFSNGISLDIAKSLEMGDILAEIMGGKRLKSSNMLFLPASRMGLLLFLDFSAKFFKYHFVSSPIKTLLFTYSLPSSLKTGISLSINQCILTVPGSAERVSKS